MRQHPNSDDPDVIERDMERTRARMDRTLEEIQDRLSPGQLLDEGLRYLRNGPQEHLSTFGSNLGHAVRDNPLPVALIGIGVAWLAMGQQNGHARSTHASSHDYTPSSAMGEDYASKARNAAAGISKRIDESEEAFERRRQLAMARVLDLKERAGESTAELKSRVEQAMSEAAARWEAMKSSMRRQGRAVRDGTADYMARAGDAASEGWSRAGRGGEQAMEIFERQPLLAAAAGVTAGALLGALLPTTEREAEVVEPYRETLRARGTAAAREALDTASAAGRAAAWAALGEVEQATSEPASQHSSAASSPHTASANPRP